MEGEKGWKKMLEDREKSSSLEEMNRKTLLALSECIPGGLSSIIGSGGKTSLIHALSLILSKKGKVLLSTSTHIYPFSHCENIIVQESDSPEKILSLVKEGFKKENILCLGVEGREGKLSKAPIPFSMLESCADYILIEADGSKRVPAKAHNERGPQIPKESKLTILVFGASALNKEIRLVVHRPEIFRALFSPAPPEESLLSKEILAEALQKEGLGDMVLVNQADFIEKKEQEKLRSFLEKTLQKPVFLSSLISFDALY